MITYSYMVLFVVSIAVYCKLPCLGVKERTETTLYCVGMQMANFHGVMCRASWIGIV